MELMQGVDQWRAGKTMIESMDLLACRRLSRLAGQVAAKSPGRELELGERKQKQPAFAIALFVPHNLGDPGTSILALQHSS